jgi:putative oxidoreductase
MISNFLRAEKDIALGTARILLGLLLLARQLGVGTGWSDWEILIHLVTLPAPLILLAVVTDFAAGIALIIGLFTRAAAVLVAAEAIVTFILWKFDPVVYTDWMIMQGGDMRDFCVLAFALAVVLALGGAGAFSLDNLLSRRARRSNDNRLGSVVKVTADDRRDDTHSHKAAVHASTVGSRS